VVPLRRTNQKDGLAFRARGSGSRTSHGVQVASGRCMSQWSAAHRVPAVRLDTPFRRSGRVSIPAVPRLSRVGFIPSCGMSSSECLRLPSCAAFPFGAVLPWGSVPLRGITGSVHVRGGSQPPAAFRPQVFSTSRRLAPLPASRACFIPQPRPGFPFRVLVPTRSRASSSPAVPPCPSSRTRSPVARLPPARDWASRP
jgi:hypothetical protein